MALIEAQIYSEILMSDVNVSVVLPLPSITNLEYGDDVAILTDEQKYPTLWLLHPGTNNYSKLVRRTRIESFSRENRIAVVMMDLGHSYCCNVPHLGNYFDYYTEELPKILRGVFPLSSRREDNFIGGISMGGFGAFMAAAKKPENYAAAFSISGGLDLEIAAKHHNVRPYMERVMNLVYGENRQYYDKHEHDLRTVMEDLVSGKKEYPKLYACCGLQDELYESGKAVIDYMQSIGLQVDYEEGQGNHNFDYYDPQLKHIISDWLPVKSHASKEGGE
ncbi:MAG: alpha/beta hydrolase-fold protein [Lacrimispora sp.]|uniref:alpha/beta hydrolase n=1 Tax=Lacrimispora sp. TaxID=2719234 RepID=UPI0039E68960